MHRGLNLIRVLIYQSGCVGVEAHLYSADLTLLLCAVMGKESPAFVALFQWYETALWALTL